LRVPVITPPEAAGLFGPGSMTWHVDREIAVLLGSGARALMLQVAHPLVAAAVADHSRFERDPIGRLRATLDAIYSFAFADAPRARSIVERVNHMHAHITGVAPDDRPYAALDPHLMLWVYATLIDSSLLAFDTFVARLSTAQREAYYAEFRQAGPVWGIPEVDFPASLADLRAWMDDLVARGDVRVTEQGRHIGGYILEPPVWWLPKPFTLPTRLTTLWLLPPPLRAGFGYDWGPRRERLMRTVAAASRATVPRLPRLLRDLPVASEAYRRVGAA
jgi:uncharacterized protein (DUF2236 family)